MIKNCPVCGKAFDVLWPEIYRYKREGRYICSYGCWRQINGEYIEMNKFTKEQKQEAIRIALEGGDPKAYLKSIGSSAPEKLWSYMKTQMLKKDPETYEKLAGSRKRADEQPESEFTPVTVTLGDAMAGMKAATDEFFGKCKAMGLKTITDDDVEAKMPEVDLTIKSEDLFTEEEREFEKRATVTAIRVEGLGEFYFDKKFKAIDWRTEDGDEVSLGPAWWLQLAEDLPLILKKLGVN